MRRKLFLVISFWLSVLALGQNPSQNQTTHQQQLEVRRQNFGTGRQLLLNKRVPFDPDELLRDGWAKNLKSTLDAMPEMHQARYETAPLKDVYMADTLYLPENVRLSGHTLILANYVVFEGKHPVIKGNFDLHFFPAKPVVVLETSLAAVLQKKAFLLNVRSDGKPALPSFSLIQDVVPTGKHEITFDVSGEPWLQVAPPRPPQRPAPRLKTTSWNWMEPVLLPQQKDCSKSCDNNGAPQDPASPGFSPGKAAPGNPNYAGAPPADMGSCGTGSSIQGTTGQNGGDGVDGDNAGNGDPGLPGNNAGNINVDIANGDTNQYTFNANGGQGQQGGPGGTGGTGGDGGQGQAGGTGASCAGCVAGDGGLGGRGGAAGLGGLGGTGGKGGNGGNGGVISGTYSYNGPKPTTSYSGGPPGAAGAAGFGGFAGTPGAGGAGGDPGTACGIAARHGNSQGGGPAVGSKGVGQPGQNGDSFGQQGTASLAAKPAPSGGGGGGGSGDCTDLTQPCQLCDPSNHQNCASPIIVDVGGEGFHLTSFMTGVAFDISGTDKPVQMGWTDPRFHNAFLALPGSDGLVHSGKELFGNFTPQPQSANPNGFIALAQFDKPENGGNGDGIIDDRDDVFSKLRLWIDENHDGICQPGELHRLPELGVYSLALTYVESRRTDPFGNQFRYKGQVNPGERKDPRDQTGSGNPGRWTYDVFLVTK